MAVNEPLHIDAGATYGPRTITYTNDDGTAFDFTGYTANLQIRKADLSGNHVIEKTPTINTGTGEITFTLTAADTGTLTDLRYRWALELTHATKPVIRLLQGRVTVSAEVNK